VSRRALVLSSLLLAGCSGKDVTVFRASGGGAVGAPSGGSMTGGASGSTSGDASSGSPPATGGQAGGSASNGGSDPGNPGGGGGGEAGTVCSSKDDCPQGFFCEMPSCDAATGLCDLRPPTDMLDYSPVCGCDGVTYWNDNTRRQAGAALLGAGTCSTTARTCSDGTDCGVEFASCARLVSRGEQCAPSSAGACWLLPPDCPDQTDDRNIWQECRPPVQGVPPPPCFDTCRAIRSERPHQRPRDLKLCQ
jgi:hypothetical protein